ncbi:hypothetical protein MPRG_40340 [Mycobacterium paragordonae]|uniref:Uncharacterized protein n=1 Tax=Mycobacterium paragordonae TaxID=1389713 RepID=A0ABQ1C8E9_9MYCO|nr:hypothetical protein MPRG_40340 [Mycobacterium paragordonae]
MTTNEYELANIFWSKVTLMAVLPAGTVAFAAGSVATTFGAGWAAALGAMVTPKPVSCKAATLMNTPAIKRARMAPSVRLITRPLP